MIRVSFLRVIKAAIGILFIAVFILRAQDENFIENAGFEKGIQEWESPAWERKDGKIWLAPVVDRGNSQGIGGMCSMRLNYTDKTICHLNYNKPIALPQGKKDYVFSV